MSIGQLTAGALSARITFGSHVSTEFRAIAPFEASEDAPPAAVEPDADEAPPSRWRGVLCVEGLATGDGRQILADALVWTAPMPLRMVLKDVGGHDGAEVCGSILTATRDGSLIRATGDFDMESEAGREAARLVHRKRMNGVSVDLDDVRFEVKWLDDEGNEVTPEEDPEEYDASEEMLMVYSAARVRAATLVAIPAFIDATIESDDGTVEEEDAPADEGGDAEDTEAPAPDGASSRTVTAGAPPVVPPHAWFRDPQLTGPTPVTITPQGHVYGHLAAWDSCHTAQPDGPGICTAPPRSATNYARFHTGSLQTRSPEAIISTGRLTMATGHAPWNAKPQAAAAHYDNTGTAVADVRAGEDEHGIWVSGALRPGVTPAQIRTLRASPLSGDWRMVDGNLELHAALAVNVPGFPVPRPSGMVAGGEVTSLVAAGMLAPPRVRRRSPEGDELTDSDLAYLKRLANDQRAHERARLAERVNASRAIALDTRIRALALRAHARPAATPTKV